MNSYQDLRKPATPPKPQMTMSINNNAVAQVNDPAANIYTHLIADQPQRHSINQSPSPDNNYAVARNYSFFSHPHSCSFTKPTVCCLYCTCIGLDCRDPCDEEVGPIDCSKPAITHITTCGVFAMTGAALIVGTAPVTLTLDALNDTAIPCSGDPCCSPNKMSGAWTGPCCKN